MPALELRGDETAIYESLAARLRRTVGSRLALSDELVEEACQDAWVIFLRRQPHRGPTLFWWLVTVATRVGYAISDREARELPLCDPGAATPPFDPPDDLDALDRALEARRALRAIDALPERQRRYAMRFAAGLSYNEIAAEAGATRTNVNKHLTRARARLRELHEITV